MLVAGFLAALLLPEAAWANISYPPGMKLIPPTLIILLPLVMLFTELGGAYPILEATASVKFKLWNRWKPILAVATIVSPAFISVYWGPTLFIIIGVVIFSLIRGLKLIYFGLHKKNSEKPHEWMKHSRPKRLIPAGVMIICVTLILSGAMAEGITHPRPKPRAYDSYTKSNLHNIFLACKAYWADSGSSNACNYDVFTLTSYGYIQSGNVVVAGRGGSEKSFNITAMNQNSKKAFEINEVGKISQLEGEYESISGQTIDLRDPDKIPEKPNLFSKAWRALVSIYN